MKGKYLALTQQMQWDDSNNSYQQQEHPIRLLYFNIAMLKFVYLGHWLLAAWPDGQIMFSKYGEDLPNTKKRLPKLNPNVAEY